MSEPITTPTASNILIGDLLVRSEMATPRDMADAIPISLKTGLPIGRVLIGAGALSEAHLGQSLLAQSLIRDSLLSVDLAVQALRIVVREGFNLEQALRIVGWQSETFVSENRLGQLLMAAGAIKPEQLEVALNVFYTAGLPLARVLVVQGVISNLVAYAGLSSQQLLREGKLTRDQAVQCVKAAMTSRAQIEDNYVNGYLRMQPSNNVRLGELLVLAGMAREEDVMQAVEWAVTRGETLGDVLISRSVILQEELERALDAQRLVTQGLLDSSHAGEVLKKANFERTDVIDALDALEAANAKTPGAQSPQTKPSPAQPPQESQKWLAEAQAAKAGVRPRTDQETRARLLGSRMLVKIEALFTRNSYLKNIIREKTWAQEEAEDRALLEQMKNMLEKAEDFDHCMDLVDKFMAKMETYSYHNGYLRARLDTMSSLLEMQEKVKEAEQDAAAWRERVHGAIHMPGVIVGRNDQAVSGSASGEALVTSLTTATPVITRSEQYVTSHDIVAMVSSTVSMSQQALPVIKKPDPKPEPRPLPKVKPIEKPKKKKK